MNAPHLTDDPGFLLRRRAEDIAARNHLQVGLVGERVDADAMVQLLHELQVHQIELEMQNDQLRETQLELDATRARYFDLFDLAPVGYCTVSEHDVILEANFSAASMLNLVRSDLVRQPVSRFIQKADQDIYYRCRSALFEAHVTQDCELQMVKRDGTPFWVHIKTSAASDASGAPIQRMTLTDITEHKRVDAMLRDKALELESARAAADKATLAKSNFLSNMTHELRSPLNAILGFAQLLEMGSPPPTETQKKNVDQILRAGWYLLDLIGEVLDFSAIESGNMTLALEPVALGDVLHDCRAMMEAQAHKAKLNLVIAPLDQLYIVNVDRTRLKQVLVNLLSNAIKYNRPGGAVEVTCHQQSHHQIRINVRDTGDGLSAAKIANLFQPFNRLGRETRAEEGTGIGLAVSKRLVELMGGSIGAHSTVGVGSVFWFELNLLKETP